MSESAYSLEAQPTASQRAGAWIVLTLAAMAVAVAATWGAWSDIYHFVKTDEEASHVLLVPVVVIWLVVVRRSALAGYRPGPSLMAPLLIALGWAVGHYGLNHARQALWHAQAVLILAGCIVAVLGWGIVRRLWPAFLLLIFLIPVPGMARQQIAIPLERATAALTQWLLHLVGLPIFRSGNRLEINGHPVDIVEACNGMRMAIPLFLVVYVFCFSLPLRAAVRWLLLVLSPGVSILCNVIRLIPTVCLYGYCKTNADGSNPKAEGFHDISGWLMLPLALVLLLFILWVLGRLHLRVMDHGEAPHVHAGLRRAAIAVTTENSGRR